MAVNRTLPSGARSFVACFSRRFLRCSSFRLFSACCLAGGKRYARRDRKRRAITLVINMVINEVKEQIGKQQLNPPPVVAHEEGKLRRWLIPLIIVLVAAGV